MKSKYTTLTLVFLMFSLLAISQKHTLEKAKSTLSIFGTSTLHDWEIVAEEMVSTVDAETDADGVSVNALTFKVPVKSLKSGKGGMDDNTYKALKAKKFPEIVYKLSKVNSSSAKGGKYELQTTGALTIAGTTKTIPLKVMATKDLQFTGETTFKMSDYGIDPPTALLGTIKTGDEITIKFNINYN